MGTKLHISQRGYGVVESCLWLGCLYIQAVYFSALYKQLPDYKQTNFPFLTDTLILSTSLSI